VNRTFRVASSLVLSIGAAVLLVAFHDGCTTTTPATSHPAPREKGHEDATADAARPRDAGTESMPHVDGGPPVLTALRVTTTPPSDASTAMTLVPAFSPEVHDYYIRCTSGTNALSVSLTASPGAEGQLLAPRKSAALPEQTISPLEVDENQAIVAVARGGSTSVEYWVRCLPHDFPDIEMIAHPEAGTPLPGYYLVGNFLAVGPMGGYAMVLDGAGVPVWYHLETRGGVCNVDNVIPGAISFAAVVGGPFEIFDLGSAEETDHAPAGVPLDLHELRVLSNGDYLVLSAPKQTGIDLTGLSLSAGDAGKLGPGSTIDGCNIEEFDPTTGALVWTWAATDHFDPAKSCTEPTLAPPLADGGKVIDTFHCNSIDVDPVNGNLLVSARQMDSVFYIERTTGSVLWKMGGRDASIDDATYVPVASPFSGQHDARLLPGWSTCAGGQISLFDDETYGKDPARAVLFDVVVGAGDGGCEAGTPGATVAWQYEGEAQSGASGSFRISADGSRVIGWGLASEVVFTEVDEDGNDLLDLHSVNSAFRSPMQSYRAIKVPLTALDLSLMRASAGLP
jgi:hypothetical protein